MYPIRNQVRPRSGRRSGADRGGRLSRRYALAWLCLTVALFCGLTRVANAVNFYAPPAPTGLTAGTAGTAGNSEVDLTWDAPTAPPGLTLTGYDVYQGTSTGGESPTPVNSVLVTTTGYTVPSLDSGTTYYFVVTAIYQNSGSVDMPSFPSNEATATTNPAGSHTSPPPGAPSPGGLAAEAASSFAVDLTWDAPTAPPGLTLTGYDVYQGTSPGGESTTPVNSVPVTTTSYTVPGLDSATTYYFDVTAIYRSGQSPPSREASATTEKSSSAPQAQVVYFGPLASHAVGVSFTVSASASSGLPVSFGSDTPRVCAVTGSTVRTLVAGQCEIQASQGGDAGFQRAAAVIQGFTVSAVGASTPPPKPTAPSNGPGTLVAILLVVAILLMAGILALLAARLKATRPQLHARPPTPQAARIRTEPQLGPPAAVHIRVTGTDATHAVRIEPHPGTRSTTIEEVQS
jgi:Fibronectin type III domain